MYFLQIRKCAEFSLCSMCKLVAPLRVNKGQDTQSQISRCTVYARHQNEKVSKRKSAPRHPKIRFRR
jgi:hypothetical protein